MISNSDDIFELCSDDDGAAAFIEAQTTWLAKRQSQLQETFLNSENSLRYSHGNAVIHPADSDSGPSDMELHSSTWTIKFDDVRDNNIQSWAEGLVQLADHMHSNFMGLMIRTLNESTERTGNVVDAQSVGSFPKAFMEMMEKIEFSVDRQGKVTMPSMMVHPDVAEKQIAELEAQPPEFKAAFAELKARKTAEALNREAERKARFKGHSG